MKLPNFIRRLFRIRYRIVQNGCLYQAQYRRWCSLPGFWGDIGPEVSTEDRAKSYIDYDIEQNSKPRKVVVYKS